MTLYELGRQRWLDEMEAEKARRNAVLRQRLARILGWSEETEGVWASIR
jgi:hypothetical protein